MSSGSAGRGIKGFSELGGSGWKGNGGLWKSVKDGCDLVAGSWSWSFVCALTRAPTLKRQLKETTEMMMTMMWILMEVEIVMVMVLRRPDIFDSEEGSKALDAAY
uniref:HDC03209 n=1 Tax=Drosophila melanogaster TaxID=7227 RepID=Q6IH59_DROME|nr:TPA_inf: HDC03209 [Drosophila melanogaster]